MSGQSPENKQHNEKVNQISPLPQSMTVKGVLMGAAITAFLSWNTGKYNRIGLFLKRWKFTRRFVMVKTIEGLPSITNYNYPPLDTVANNFFCYSGEPGIGKSFHFQQLMSKESMKRPTLYVSFKSTGREANFESDLADQLNFGEQASGMIAELIRAIRKISKINQKPNQFQLKLLAVNCALIGGYYLTYLADLSVILSTVIYGSLFSGHCYFNHFIAPLLSQSIRRSIPVIVFDDLNKIEHMNMLAEIVRFLRLIEGKETNIMLVSSDEETWSKLRREPGMKDRLRVRQIKYDHIETANRLLEVIEKDFEALKKNISAHHLFEKVIVKAMVKELIGTKQMSLRRFVSVLKLIDEEEYEIFADVLQKKDLSTSQIVTEFTKILFDSEMETMVSNLKIIKRELCALSDKEFIENLELLLRKFKLPADNKVGAILKVYNIVRDLRSEYVINGRFTYIIYQLAVQEYVKDMKEYQQFGQNTQNLPPANSSSSNSTE